MNVTLDQARALDALARYHTLAKAAAALGKQHSALVYALKNLETQTGLVLLDRSGYRTRLTPAGERVLEECRRLLAVSRDLELVCRTIQTGWEPTLRVVFDGIFPARAMLAQLKALGAAKAPTRVDVFAEFLSGVEKAFFAREADLMISVLPPRDGNLAGTALPVLDAHLVAHRTHPLTRTKRATLADLRAHTLLTVRGSDPRLLLPTAPLEPSATVQLNDFHSKREAILDGMGFGWLPDYLVREDLKKGTLRRVPFELGDRHVFAPQVYALRGRALGRAATAVVAGLTEVQKTSP
jgi:DNA-binding transcriptional LysR family regulator